MKREFTVGQMAKILSVARTTIINWIKAGKLDSFTLPGGNNRVTRENFVKFMNEYDIPLSLLDDEYSGNTKVLIVDDDKEVLRVLEQGLKKEGIYDVKTAESFLEAGLLLKEFRPGVVALDSTAQGMSPKEISKVIRGNSERKKIKLIAISGKVSQQKGKEYVKQGFDAFLKKPFDIDALHGTIQKL